MPRTIVVSIFVTAALLACGSARATVVLRAWVSGHGADAPGCGAPTNPCRSLQWTHDNIVAPGGEIDILDPAGYGSITITKAISIVNDGVGTAGVQQANAGQNAIQINAATTDAVTLRGLNIDGLGVARDGIGVLGAGSLTVVDCVIRHFVHDGVYVQNGGVLTLSLVKTSASDNGANGFDISPQGGLSGVVDQSFAMNNASNGVVVWGLNASGAVLVTIANSNLSLNGNDGLLLNGFDLTHVAVRNDVADGNTEFGYEADAGIIVLSHSEALSDGLEIKSGVVAWSFGDNAISDVLGNLTLISQH